MFDDAILFTMRYEVGPWFILDQETLSGACETQSQKRKTGWVNDDADTGKETKFGISAAANPLVDIESLTWAQAKEIYRTKYWLAGKCDQLYGNLAFAHFDACVNHGVKKANQLLQRAVGVPDDGIIGPQTLKAIMAAMPTTDLVAKQLNERKKLFKSIVENNPSQQKFLKGWFARCDDIARVLIQ